MKRAARSPTRATTASVALSFLDIVSAGFGGAVFLFVIFASLPIDTLAPAQGGGRRFIDVQIEWSKQKGNEVFTAEEGGGDWIEIAAQYESNICDVQATGNRLSDSFEASDPKRERIRFKSYRQLSPIDKNGNCRVELVVERWESTSEGRVPSRQARTAKNTVVDLHITREEPDGTKYRTRLSSLAGAVRTRTDTPSAQERVPWKSIQIVGFDPFGRYEALADPGQQHMTHVRILEPHGGGWQFGAKLYTAGGATDGMEPVKVSVTTRCGERGQDTTTTAEVELNAGRYSPTRIEASRCEFGTIDRNM